MFRKLVCIAVAAVGMTACNKSRSTTKNGVEYVFHKGDTTGKKAKMGDIVTLEYAMRNSKDSILQSTAQLANRVTQYKMAPPPYPGSWQDGLAMVSEGDSVTFFEVVKHTVRIAKIQNQADLMKEQENSSLKQKEVDAKLIADYVAKNKLSNVQQTASGLNYLITQPGTGKQAQANDTVSVHYTLKTLDGKAIESSRERGQPFPFTLGQRQVIPGWDEGIALMKEGGKATLIVPSGLAYGPSASGPIAANSVLLFDVELVDVK
ncbi:MAG: FKBP-type peptidyl-prolyl cis-trans isomerase [Ferruginibacter sp.]|nr:FKBP-type peptidyl-prolyl cis-trans isomerase [Cytophagales bacterium]